MVMILVEFKDLCVSSLLKATFGTQTLRATHVLLFAIIE